MKKLLLVIFLFDFCPKLFCQTLNFEWSRSWISQTTGTDVDIDNLGNVYLISYGNTTTNFNPTNSSQIFGPTYQSAAVTKLDANGNLIWVKFIDEINSGGHTPENICIKNGNLYVTGKIGVMSCFVMKCDLDGNFIWKRTINSLQCISVRDIFIDANDNVLICGGYSQSINIGTVYLNSNGGGDCFFVKFSSIGDMLIFKSFGGNDPNEEEILGICSNSSGDIYLSGFFYQSVDFDPGAGQSILNCTSAGGKEFISKFDIQGNFIWAHTLMTTTPLSGRANDILLDENENIHFTGYAFGTVDFDPSASISNLSHNHGYAYIAKWNPNAGFIWAKGIFGDGDTQGFHLSFKNSNILLAGTLSGGSADFDSSPNEILLSSSGIYSSFVLKINSMGQYLWAGVLDHLNSTSQSFNRPKGVVQSSNAILVCGDFVGTIDSNPLSNQISSLSSSDWNIGSNYIIKLGQCNQTTSTQTITSCSSYSWSVNNQTYTSSGVFIDTISNSAGCDSTVTLNLVITSPVTNSINISSCNFYNWNGTNYTSSGIYNQVLSNVNGCDSTVTLNLVITNSPIAFINSNNGIVLIANSIPDATYQWIYCSDLTIINNQNQNQLIPEINGLYSVIVTNQCGSDTSECVNVNDLGIIDLTSTSFHVYPNPANDHITIDNGNFALMSNYTLKIENSLGQQVFSSLVNQQQFYVDLNGWSGNGVYFLKLINPQNNIVTVRKIVLQ